MQPDYTRCYETLNLLPGSEWSDVRATYKNLVGRWHPDRFPNDANNRRLAEERIKDITEAYRALEEYYRQHGVTPAPPKPSVSALESPATTTPAQTDVFEQEPIFAPNPVRESPHAHRTLMWILLMAAVLMLIYFLTEEEPHSTSTPPYEESRSSADIFPVNVSDSAIVDTNKGPRFSVGSTLGDVYAAQGIPTKIEGDTWRYGESAVHFAKGKVTSWTDHPTNPLKADIDGPGAALQSSLFGRGSSKADVRRIQGAPSRETDSVWEYGPSKIYFKVDRVTSWHESPLFPLRAAK